MVADPKAGAALIEDMLKEGDAGVASGMHSYYHRPRPELNQTGPEDPTAHIAAFMLVRRELWYYTGSTGWFDRDFKWSSVYDDAAKCGRPLAPAMRPAPRVYTREYERCHVMVNCTKRCARAKPVSDSIATAPRGRGHELSLLDRPSASTAHQWPRWWDAWGCGMEMGSGCDFVSAVTTADR
eukprot:scaffold14916_cov128-Isochrysis_galbana.AAC.15